MEQVKECEGCGFWKRYGPEWKMFPEGQIIDGERRYDENFYGQCRRFPTAGQMVVTAASDWCGEFQEDPK